MRPITTDIVGARERFDQRESMFSQAAAGRADHPLIKRWIEVEPPDFLLRALMGIPRGENSVLHHLMAAADGPVNPSPAPLPEPAALSRKIKALARFCGADLVGVCRIWMQDRKIRYFERRIPCPPTDSSIPRPCGARTWITASTRGPISPPSRTKAR